MAKLTFICRGWCGGTPYGGAVVKTIPNLALKPTVMVGKKDIIMAAISFRRAAPSVFTR